MASVNLSREQLERLRQFDTCTLSNAIERLNIRPRNEGFVAGTAACRFPRLPAVIGYAVTARMRSSMPPVSGRCYYEHADWWKHVTEIPSPRIVVIQDADHSPGVGALFGEAYARISRALGCVACVTNGAVRDIPGIEAPGFPVIRRRSLGFSRLRAHRGIWRSRGDWRLADIARRSSPWRSARSSFDSVERRRQTGGACGAGVAGRPGVVPPDRKQIVFRGHAGREAGRRRQETAMQIKTRAPSGAPGAAPRRASVAAAAFLALLVCSALVLLVCSAGCSKTGRVRASGDEAESATVVGIAPVSTKADHAAAHRLLGAGAVPGDRCLCQGVRLRERLAGGLRHARGERPGDGRA